MLCDETNRQQVHVHALGITNFRMLTLTTNQNGVKRMLDALNAITNVKGSNMFLYAAQESEGTLDPAWINGKRNSVHLKD